MQSARLIPVTVFLLIHEAQQGCRDATYEPSRFPVAVPYPSPHRATPAYVVVTSSDLDTSRNKASVSGLSWISRTVFCTCHGDRFRRHARKSRASAGRVTCRRPRRRSCYRRPWPGSPERVCTWCIFRRHRASSAAGTPTPVRHSSISSRVSLRSRWTATRRSRWDRAISSRSRSATRSCRRRTRARPMGSCVDGSLLARLVLTLMQVGRVQSCVDGSLLARLVLTLMQVGRVQSCVCPAC